MSLPHLGTSRRALGLALWTCLLPTLALGATPALRQAVSYVEFQQRASAPVLGRTLPGNRGPQSIDADSNLRININRQSVVESLLPATTADAAQLKNLRERIERLTPLVDTVKTLAIKHNQATRAFLSSRVTVEEYSRAVADESGALLASFGGLEEAISLRRQDEGQGKAAADAEAEKLIETLLLPREQGGYDYVGLGRNIDVELRALNRRTEALLDTSGARVGVEVRAHLVKQDGSVVAVRLAGYNEEELGAPTRFRRIQTELSQEERDAYAAYEKLARELQSAKNAGEALRMTFEQLYPSLSNEARQTLREIIEQVQAVRASLDALADSLRPEQLTPWLNGLPGDFPADLKRDFEALTKELQGLKQELDELERLRANLADRLPTLTPLQAHDEVALLVRTGSGLLSADRWRKRQQLVTQFFQTFEREKPQVARVLLTSGPLKAANDAKAELVRLVEVLVKAAERLQALRKALGVAGPSVAAAWPEPVEQKRRSGAMELGTDVDLSTIKGGREEGDTLVINHRFYVDDTLSDEWEDRFIVEAYGWRGSALAGLAFHARHRGGVGAWKPSATVGWYVTYRPWPGNSDRLSGSRIDYIGVGVSAISLDFDDTQDIELGIAGALSLFNNFAQVGYGANLSVDNDRGFFFFSIRPLQLGELLGSGGGL